MTRTLLVRPLLALAASLLLAPAAAAAQAAQAQHAPDSLTLAEAIGLARENNPGLQQQRNDVGVARSQVRSAVGGLLPSASVNTNFGYRAPGELRLQSLVVGEEPESYFSSYGLNVGYQLNGSSLLQPSVQRAQQRATERRVTGAEANLDMQVAQQYLSVLQAREQVAQAEREVGRADEYVRLAQARLEVGAGTPLDVRRAEVTKGRAEVSLLQARNGVATSILVLGQLLGLPLDPDVKLSSAFEVFDPSWDVNSLVEMAVQDNPLLLAARASSSAARTQVSAARSAYLPNLNFSVGWSGYVNQYGDVAPLVDRELGRINFEGCQRNNRVLSLIGEAPQQCLNPADPNVAAGIRNQLESRNRGFPFDYINQPLQAGVSISLPVFNGFDRELQVDQAKAQAADARYQERAEELRLRQEVASAVQALETAYRTALLQEQVRAASAEELRLAQERFRFGAANSVEVTDAQTNLSQAERDQIDAVYNFHKSLATLEALVGRRLR